MNQDSGRKDKMIVITDEIKELKQQRNAVILAHNYVLPEVQEIADYTGDSLELSIKAANVKADVIVFCGVRFMAETAKVLSPDAMVLLPNPDAGCPMADMADGEEVAAYRRVNPDAVLVAYVNSTAEVKAGVDVCCTSGNVETIIKSIPPDRPILFLPDKNLGANMARKLNRPMALWHGFCPTHDQVSVEAIRAARKEHPDALVLVHPECRPQIVAESDQAMSTGGILRYVRESAHKEFIIGTECGIMHRLKKENPGKNFYPLKPVMVCPNMKKITLEHVRNALRDLSEQVELSAEMMVAARKPIQRMLETK